MKDKLISQIKLLIFDFDGVLTDNKVYVNEKGEESVMCNRADGLAFEALKKVGIETIIVSTEKNKVVKRRAEKLNVKLIQGVSNKLLTVEQLAQDNGLGLNQIMFIGNDINDLSVIRKVGWSACPIDSHKLVKKSCTFIFNRKGGDAIARELVEDLFYIDMIKLLDI
tara:strand:+ start:1229 stop:1729 length:501 start_codon:yes stop_codon:yes gene_type:complete